MNWTVIAVSAINALIPILTPVAVHYVRLGVGKIPRWIIPIFAVSLGAGLNWLVTFAAGGQFNPILAGLLGFAVVVVREIYSTISEHGLIKP